MNPDEMYDEHLANAEAARALIARMAAAGAETLGDLWAIETTEAATVDGGELDELLGGAS